MHFLSLSFFIFQNIFFCIVGKSFLKILLVNMPKICRILREHSMATDFQCYVHGYTLRSIVKVGKQKFLLLLFLFILVSIILRAFSLFLSLSLLLIIVLYVGFLRYLLFHQKFFAFADFMAQINLNFHHFEHVRARTFG